MITQEDGSQKQNRSKQKQRRERKAIYRQANLSQMHEKTKIFRWLINERRTIISKQKK